MQVRVSTLSTLILIPAFLQAQQWTLKSPDSRIVVSVDNQKDGLTYSVLFNGDRVLEASPMGIERTDGLFDRELTSTGDRTHKITDRYNLVVGKKLNGRTEANELVISMQNASQKKMELIIRAYDGGVAYRYRFPENQGRVHKIIAEHSGFAVPQTARAWIQPYDLNVRKKPCYETYYEDAIKPGAASPNPAGWAYPLLFNLESHWVLISESGLDESYCATHLEDKNGNGIYTVRFPETEEVTSDAEPYPVSSLPWTTPWRVIVIGSSLNDIVGTMMVTDLAPASRLGDLTWLKPGRASWSWWSVGSSARDYQAQIDYINFTASMGWEYVLIDSGWPRMEGGTVEDVVRHANSIGVGIFLWYHSGMGREADTLSIANLMAFPEERQKEMKRISEMGVKGIKVDFFDSDKQPVIKRYMDILKDAAEYKLMVNFHGSTLPRGWERTYPHLMTMESVKGAEGYGRQEFCDKAPAHNTILPFTRNVVGSMDYTPVTFTNKREAIRQTTVGHELALSVVFESGIFHFADRMTSYQALPDDVKSFLREIPVTWDDTRLVAGFPGDYVVIARRKGDQWFIGGINGQNEPLDIELDLDFLTKAVSIDTITDGESTGSFSSATLSIKNGTSRIQLQPHGGFVGVIKN